MSAIDAAAANSLCCRSAELDALRLRRRDGAVHVPIDGTAAAPPLARSAAHVISSLNVLPHLGRDPIRERKEPVRL
jgi:hypothetical protein